MKRFYFSELTLSNFRRFDKKTFHLNRQMNVFIGKNASGKTSIIEAATIQLGAYLSSFKEYVPSRYVMNISEGNDDVHLKNKHTSLSDLSRVVAPDKTSQFPCAVKSKIVLDDRDVYCNCILEKSGGRTKFQGGNPFRKMVSTWEEAVKKNDGSDRTMIFPLALYLSSARLWNENNISKELTEIPGRFEAYQRCLDRKHSANLAFDYLKLLQNIANEEAGGRPYPVYSVVMEAIGYALKGELEKGQRVIISSRYNNQLVLRNEDGTLIKFDSLSDGYRNVIKIIADIAVRMCILNPFLEEKVLLETPGVVVIDELDLSLHPTWQRRIVDILKKTFPKIQFICATHSPFIIQSLSSGELQSLDSDILYDYSGKSIEDIAEMVMNVTMPMYSEKKLAMLEAAEKYMEALGRAASEDELKELKNKLDSLEAVYSDNPAYIALLKLEYMNRKADI